MIVRFDRQNLGDRARIVCEIRSLTGTDLDHNTGQVRQERAAVFIGAPAVHSLHSPGIGTRESGMLEFGGA